MRPGPIDPQRSAACWTRLRLLVAISRAMSSSAENRLLKAKTLGSAGPDQDLTTTFPLTEDHRITPANFSSKVAADNSPIRDDINSPRALKNSVVG